MHRRQPEVEVVIQFEQMVQIAERVAAAGGAIAVGRHRPGGLDVLVVAGVDVAEPVRADQRRGGRVAAEGVEAAVAGVAGGHGAVE